MLEDDYDIVISGAGPCGLLIANLLQESKFRILLIEARTTRSTYSRSFGLHPPSLQILDRLGLLEEVLQESVKINFAEAFYGDKLVGKVSFEELKQPYNYICSIPQTRLEEILEKNLKEELLIRPWKNTDFVQDADGATLQIVNQQNGQVKKIKSSYVLACDGYKSFLRNYSCSNQIVPYDDFYSMADFKDAPALPAAVYLNPKGLVERFPLPGNKLRMIIKTDEQLELSPNEFCSLVKERIGIELNEEKISHQTSFQPQRFIVEKFIDQRLILCGDAAHILSPIGGQGLNLGWINAQDLVDSLLSDADLSLYEKRSRKRAKRCSFNARFNMSLGRSHRYSLIHRLLLNIVINSPIKGFFRKSFSMSNFLS